jgi:hypothetical protein
MRCKWNKNKLINMLFALVIALFIRLFFLILQGIIFVVSNIRRLSIGEILAFNVFVCVTLLIIFDIFIPEFVKLKAEIKNGGESSDK